jgi:hypothetical protein
MQRLETKTSRVQNESDEKTTALFVGTVRAKVCHPERTALSVTELYRAFHNVLRDYKYL